MLPSYMLQVAWAEEKNLSISHSNRLKANKTNAKRKHYQIINVDMCVVCFLFCFVVCESDLSQIAWQPN